jgi:hypothetical protein
VELTDPNAAQFLIDALISINGARMHFYSASGQFIYLKSTRMVPVTQPGTPGLTVILKQSEIDKIRP